MALSPETATRRRRAALNSGFPTSGLAVIALSRRPEGRRARQRLSRGLPHARPITDAIGGRREFAPRAPAICNPTSFAYTGLRERADFLATALTTFTDEARIALDTLSGRAAGLFSPSLRLGVTGLSRAGKTVFISALVHNLIHGGRLPLFEAQNSGRIARAFLEQQPDDAVPRFQYEDHVAALVDERIWPDSTRAISELRLTIEYESASGWSRLFSQRQAVGRHRRLSRRMAARPAAARQDLTPNSRATPSNWRSCRSAPNCREDWRQLAADRRARRRCRRDDWRAGWPRAFAAYLKACKLDERALSTLPPGRFLMPGDLEGSPALTFAPLPDLRRRARPVRLAAGHDGAPLRGLQDACGEAVLPRAHRPARPADRADRRHAGAECRPRRDGRSGAGADRDPRLLPARPRQLPHRPLLARASTAS